MMTIVVNSLNHLANLMIDHPSPSKYKQEQIHYNLLMNQQQLAKQNKCQCLTNINDNTCLAVIHNCRCKLYSYNSIILCLSEYHHRCQHSDVYKNEEI
jgi:hypothetical protein